MFAILDSKSCQICLSLAFAIAVAHLCLPVSAPVIAHTLFARSERMTTLAPSAGAPGPFPLGEPVWSEHFVPQGSASFSSTSALSGVARCYPYAPPPFGVSGSVTSPSWDFPLSSTYEPATHGSYPIPGDVDSAFDPTDEESADDSFTPNFGSLEHEANTLLCRYLGDIYQSALKPPAGEVLSVASSSLFQKSSAESGISVPSEFQDEFNRIASLLTLSPAPVPLLTAFPVSSDAAPKFFNLESLSPELVALGDTQSPNPLKSRSYKLEDNRWKFVSSSARQSLRLSTYATALSDLLCRADDLSVTSEDRENIAILLASLSETSSPLVIRLI